MSDEKLFQLLQFSKEDNFGMEKVMKFAFALLSTEFIQLLGKVSKSRIIRKFGCPSFLPLYPLFVEGATRFFAGRGVPTRLPRTCLILYRANKKAW